MTLSDYLKKTWLIPVLCLILWFVLSQLSGYITAYIGYMVAYVITYTTLFACCLVAEKKLFNNKIPIALYAVILLISFFVIYIVDEALISYSLFGAFAGIVIKVALKPILWVSLITLIHKRLLSKVDVKTVSKKWLAVTICGAFALMVILEFFTWSLRPTLEDYFGLTETSTVLGLITSMTNAKMDAYIIFSKVSECIALLCFYFISVVARFTKIPPNSIDL